MSDNKFIKHLRGTPTAGSVLEIKNQNTTTSFGKMPQGTSNPNDVFSDHRGNATAVLKGTQNWKLNGSSLVLASTVDGNGDDYTDEFGVAGSGLWLDATYTFPSTGDPAHPVAAIFNANAKWVLKLCGHGLLSDNKTIGFSFVVKLGSVNIITKNFEVPEQAFQFCQEFVIDYDDGFQSLIKASGGSTLTIQLLCNDATASATIYNGMSVLTCLQRIIDAKDVSASFANVEEVMHDGLLPNDYFSNGAIIDQVQDGEGGVPIFIRDGDTMNLGRWDQPIPDQTGNAGKFLKTDGDNLVWDTVFQKTDEVTINLNANNELEAIGVINKNNAVTATNPVYDWVGTMAEYTAQDVANQHPDWVCFITDDAYDPQSTYAYDQAIAATVWTINHNLNKHPSITVVDSAGTTVDFKATYINSNTCQLEFNAPFKGTAYLN